MGKHRTISLPDGIIRQVEKKLEEDNYSSIADFVKEAIRLRLEALNG
jgi:Arc/MetJ-type ribon-helix-helix transcriptional regulator